MCWLSNPVHINIGGHTLTGGNCHPQTLVSDPYSEPSGIRMSEYVTPVLATGGPVTLLFVALRFGSDAALRLLAGTVAVLTRDKERGERALEVLRILHNQNDPRDASPELTEQSTSNSQGSS